MSDSALIDLWGLGFATRGVIAGEPRKNEDGEYEANIGNIAPLASAVPLAFIQENHLTWLWLNACTKSYTTIEGTLEARLEEVLNQYQAPFAEPPTEGASKPTSITVYERNPLAREPCIAQYGTDSAVHLQSPPLGIIELPAPLGGRPSCQLTERQRLPDGKPTDTTIYDGADGCEYRCTMINGHERWAGYRKEI